MPYRLERDESVIAGLQRVARDEMESSGAKLGGRERISRDKAIHEARKSMKKVRALLRLMKDELRGVDPGENVRLRDIARRLSHYRDAFVMVETFDDLKKHFRAEASRKFRGVRPALIKRRNEAVRDENRRIVLDHAAAALTLAASRVARWKLKTEGYAALAPGLERTFRAGRAALALATENPTADNLHDLRKKVKDHWYHIRLLENLWTDVMVAYEKSLKDLETWLGNDHNLAVLRERIVAEPAFYGTREETDLLLDLIDRYQTELRDNSLALAERVYAEKPREFVARMSHLWNAWKQQPVSLEQSALDRTSTAA
jgi:CHAD domain-containing protein